MDYDFFGVGEQTLHLKKIIISILVIGARGGPCFEDGARERTSRSRKGVKKSAGPFCLSCHGARGEGSVS